MSSFDLKPVRDSILHLHAELLHWQKKQYELQNGRIKNSGEYFSLVTTHEDFLWLRELSALVASIDEMLDSPGPQDPVQVDSLVKFVRAMLTPDHQSQTEFAGQYFLAIQADPHAAVAHGKVVSLLKTYIVR